MKAVIIEDEKRAATLLEEMIKLSEPALEVVDICHDLPEGVKSIKRNNPDIVFLDIELPVYSGIQLLDFFNSDEVNFQIIFTTAYNEYAIKAFEMSAIDYLLKPIQLEKLSTAIKKTIYNDARHPNLFPVLKENLQPGQNKKIVVPVSNGYEIINLNEIAYLKAEGSYTQIFLAKNGSLLVSKNLRYFEELLSNSANFLRLHRSFIANLNFAKRIARKDGNMLLLENGIEIPTSDDKLDLLLSLINKI